MRPILLRSTGIISLCAGMAFLTSACCVTNCDDDPAASTDAPLEVTSTPILDWDQDGLSIDQGDCNDSDGSIHPGAAEVPYDGIDQDCNGSDLIDVDDDGYPGGSGTDCNDQDATIHPGADEIPYDGIDQDCSSADLIDNDQDGYPGGEGGSDCNDNDSTIYPGAPEYSYDGIDQDCNGSDWTDIDGDGYSGGEGGTDCDDGAEYTYPGAYEAPDGVDNDCDGLIDEGASTPTPTPGPESTPAETPDSNPGASPTPDGNGGDGDPIETPVSGIDGSAIPGCDCSTVPGQAPGAFPISAALLLLLPLRRVWRRRSIR